MDLKMWEIDDGERTWYCAESREEAMEMYLEPLTNAEGVVDLTQLGCSPDEIEVTEVSSETRLPIRDEDTGQTVWKTATEWCADGKGLVASTAY